jgi:hypothetical protein
MRKTNLPLVLVALLAGFGGGLASNWLGFAVLAQAMPVETVEARNFRLVDANGKVLGLIASVPRAGGTIQLFDETGKLLWAAPEAPVRARPLTKP